MDERLNVYEEKMTKTLESLDREYASIRAGRANPHLLDKITVDYYGSPTPLQQVGNISVPEARMIQIQPWESSLIPQHSVPLERDTSVLLPSPTFLQASPKAFWQC